MPTPQAVQRLTEALRLSTPILAVYDAAPEDGFDPVITAEGHACCFGYYGRWLKGQTVVFRRDGGGCMGAHFSLGLKSEYPPYMAHFLTDGAGAPTGEGLRARPELAQAYVDQARPPRLEGDTALIGPLRLEKWEAVRSTTFLVDPDRLGALMTLAGFWSEDPRLTQAPFSSGCGLLWRELSGSDRPVVGGTDIAMRRYVPPDIMTFSVSPARFEQMLGFPDDCFLYKEWWGDLLKHRGYA